MSLDLDHFRPRLEEERERVARAIDNLRRESPGSLEDEIEEVAADNHPADVATATVDREIGYSLQENEERLLEAIEAALGRIEDGTYGRCEVCGREIEVERLEAIPWATLCIEDKRREERG